MPVLTRPAPTTRSCPPTPITALPSAWHLALGICTRDTHGLHTKRSRYAWHNVHMWTWKTHSSLTASMIRCVHTRLHMTPPHARPPQILKDAVAKASINAVNTGHVFQPKVFHDLGDATFKPTALHYLLDEWHHSTRNPDADPTAVPRDNALILGALLDAGASSMAGAPRASSLVLALELGIQHAAIALLGRADCAQLSIAVLPLRLWGGFPAVRAGTGLPHAASRSDEKMMVRCRELLQASALGDEVGTFTLAGVSTKQYGKERLHECTRGKGGVFADVFAEHAASVSSLHAKLGECGVDVSLMADTMSEPGAGGQAPPLHSALHSNDVPTAKALLAAGADPCFAVANVGLQTTALHLAASHGSDEVAAAMLEAARRNSSDHLRELVAATDSSGRFPADVALSDRLQCLLRAAMDETAASASAAGEPANGGGRGSGCPATATRWNAKSPPAGGAGGAGTCDAGDTSEPCAPTPSAGPAAARQTPAGGPEPELVKAESGWMEYGPGVTPPLAASDHDLPPTSHVSFPRVATWGASTLHSTDALCLKMVATTLGHCNLVFPRVMVAKHTCAHPASVECSFRACCQPTMHTRRPTCGTGFSTATSPRSRASSATKSLGTGSRRFAGPSSSATQP